MDLTTTNCSDVQLTSTVNKLKRMNHSSQWFPWNNMADGVCRHI